MNTNNIYIGIDYSLKSPAICIFQNNTYKWISYPQENIFKKSDFDYLNQLSQLNDIKLIFNKENFINSEKLNEYTKILYYNNQIEFLFNLIINELPLQNINNINIYIGFEGYSFASLSNNIIDIVTASTLFKITIIKNNIFKNFTLNTYPPKIIKKFAGYGSYDKSDLFNIFINNYLYIKNKYKLQLKNKKNNFNLNYKDKLLINQPFYKFCKNLQPIIFSKNIKKIKIPKPIDDLIDSYFIVKYLYQNYSNPTQL